MKEKVVIKLEELPQRAEKLSTNKVIEIFGGCGTEFVTCFKDSECCESYTCNKLEARCRKQQ